MQYEIQRTPFAPGCQLAVVRTSALPSEFSQVVPRLCGVVWNAIRAQGIKGAGRHVAVYRDSQPNLEVGVELNDSSFTDEGEVVRSELPAGHVATTTHFGPYGRLGQAHQAIVDWCRVNGHTPAGPRWEIYGHWIDAWNKDPSQIRTDVVYLLADVGDRAHR